MSKSPVTRCLHIGIDGTEVDPETRSLIERTRPGGVILFGRNVASLDQVAALTRDLHQIDGDLIVSIDQEGGPVDRLRPHVPSLPAGMALGASRDERLTKRLGELTGRLLALLGIDWDLTPVCDQALDGNDNAIGVRSFGADPDAIVLHASALLEGLEAGGVLGAIKHFPGLGGATADSHRTLPVVATTRIDLMAGELGVFQRLVGRAPSVLVSHAYYPHLTTRGAFPATLSDEVSTTLLRQTLGFSGLTVTDDMVMGALATEEIGDASVRAVQAGADVLLVCEGRDRVERVASALIAAAQSGALDSRTLDNAARRQSAFLTRLRSLVRPAPLEPNAVDEGLRAHLALMADLASEVARRSVTAVRRGSPGRLRGEVVVLRPRVKWLSDECARPPGSPFLDALGEARIASIEIAYDSEDGDAVLARLRSETPAAWLLATSDAQRKPAVQRLARGLTEQAPVLHLALAWPRDLEGIDVRASAASYGCGWHAVHAATRVLIGEAKAVGTLPI